jgi:hypothetical protein
MKHRHHLCPNVTVLPVPANATDVNFKWASHPPNLFHNKLNISRIQKKIVNFAQFNILFSLQASKKAV